MVSLEDIDSFFYIKSPSTNRKKYEAKPMAIIIKELVGKAGITAELLITVVSHF